MEKLLIIDSHNRVLVSMDNTDKETDWQILVDNSVELTSDGGSMVIKLKESYSTHWDAIVTIVDWEVRFIDKS